MSKSGGKTMSEQKRYSFASALETKGEKGAVFAAVSGFVSRNPEEKKTANGKKYLDISLPLNNTSKKITGLFGEEAADETLWMNVRIWSGFTYDRAVKVIKKGQKILVFGKVTKFVANSGKVYYSMNANDFSLQVNDLRERIRTNMEYTFLAAERGIENEAVGVVQGVLLEDSVIDHTSAGRKVLRMKISMNKLGKKLNYPLQIEGESRAKERLTITMFEPDGFERVESVAKILKKGAEVALFGIFTTSKGDSGLFYNLVLRDFELLSKGQESSDSTNSSSGGNSYQNQKAENNNYSNNASSDDYSNNASLDDYDPFGGVTIDISDDDLPF